MLYLFRTTLIRMDWIGLDWTGLGWLDCDFEHIVYGTYDMMSTFLIGFMITIYNRTHKDIPENQNQ